MSDSCTPSRPGWLHRRTTRFCLLSLLAISLAAGWMVYQRKRYHHFAVHDPGKVYRSAYLTPDVYAEMIRRYRIKTVVNLCNGNEKCDRVEGQREAVEGAGAELVELEFPNNDTWHTDDPAFREMERIFADPQKYPLWIHCVHGKERTVKALVIYDVKYRNMTAKGSLSAMPLWGTQHPWPIVAFSFAYEAMLRPLAARGSMPEENPEVATAGREKAASVKR